MLLYTKSLHIQKIPYRNIEVNFKNSHLTYLKIIDYVKTYILLIPLIQISLACSSNDIAHTNLSITIPSKIIVVYKIILSC